MAFISRVRSAFTVSLASSIAFSTVGTTIVTIVIVPLLNIAFNVVLGSDLGAPDLHRTTYAATLVGMTLGVCSGIVSKVATDRNLGIFQEVHRFRNLDLAYWAGTAILPIVLAMPTGIVALGTVQILNNSNEAFLGKHIVLLVIVSLLAGALLGVAMAGFGVVFSDPYQGASVASAIIPLLSGVIVPTSDFPSWLKTVSSLVPMSGTVTSIHNGAVEHQPELTPAVADIVVSAIWAIIGLFMVLVALQRMRTGIRFNAL